MDVHYGSKKMFMTSYANNKPGIFVVRWVRCRYGKGVRGEGGGVVMLFQVLDNEGVHDKLC